MSGESKIDSHFMEMAIREARTAASEGEVPTGCVIIEAPESDECSPLSVRVLAKTHNQTESLKDATAHAEMTALSAAAEAKGNWRLVDTWLYVTKEPCPMCAGAIILSRVSKVIWGVSDPKRGGQSVFRIFEHPGINHHPEFVAGVKEAESKFLLQEFFRRRRKESESSSDGICKP